MFPHRIDGDRRGGTRGMTDGYRLDHVTVRSGANRLLSDVSLDIPPGRVLLVAGRSGSGKSSLGRLLTGLIPHQYPAGVEGSITLDGSDLLEILPEELAGRVAHVAAEPWSRFFQIIVRDELAFGPRNLGWPESRTKEAVGRTASRLGLDSLLDRRIDTLSAGQLQALSIGTALAMESRWLVLDEPSAYLDLSALSDLTGLLGRLRGEEGPGIVLLEHRIGDFEGIVDDVAILEASELVFRGSRTDFEASAETLCERYGLRHPDVRDPASWGGVLLEEATRIDGAPLLSMRGISFAHGRRKVLEALDLTVRPGEMLAVVGPNGCGKTTLGRIAVGLLKPDGGELLLDGVKPGPPDGRRAGMLFQNPSSMLFQETVREEILSGPRSLGITLTDGELESFSEALSLTELLERHPQRLSRGQRLRVAVAAALVLRPRLLVLDEPIRGQDWRSLRRMMEHLRGHVTQTGGSCILITHEVGLVRAFADRIALLDGGSVRALGVPIRSGEERSG